jgi:hypothetical protein
LVENDRALRRSGVTMHKTIDVVIGIYRILQDLALLHAGQDFDPMVEHLGLLKRGFE